ncbi:MAG TPA: hypothetical protein VMJ32_03180 [Pirellulales bacterium]|nr:hypothetical protein [Pirellulales bacterium]
MSILLLAAGWNDFLRLLPFVIAFLVWVIGRFASQVPQKPPQRGAAPPKPALPQPPKQAGDSLQSEIDQFLRQAQAAREGRAAAKPGEATPAAGKMRDPMFPSKDARLPSSGRPGDSGQQRTARRQPPAKQKPDAGQKEFAPGSGTTPTTIAADVARDLPQAGRGSVAQHVAEMLDSSKFTKRATELSQVQQSTDAEFRAHMQRVFQHDLGNLKKEAAGIFEAAGATANAASAAVMAKANLAAAGAESGTAPVATRKRTSDIALFLAGRKNMRDAIILTEILQRPEHRW